MKLNDLRHFLAMIAVATVFPSLAMADDTKIKATYTADYDRIRPDPQKGVHLNHTMEVALSGVNQVKETQTRQVEKINDVQKDMTILGQKSSDGQALWTVAVAGPNRLERVVNSPQSTTTMFIEVNGSSCKFNVQFKLKEGFTEYKWRQIRNGEMGFFTEPKVSSTTCSIK